MDGSLAAALPYWIGVIGLDNVLRAVDVAGGRNLSSGSERYFIATMRNIRDGTHRPKRTPRP